MPIYEYQCQACGELHEALQKVSDAPLQDCPVCGKPQLKKKVSAAGFRLKGGGWYETDFKTGNRKNVAGAAEPGKDKTGDGGKSGDSGKSGDGSKADTASPASSAKPGSKTGESNSPA
jgi:putative FmdB family regulatory protein